MTVALWPSTSSLLRVDGLNPEGIAPMAESTSVASICFTHTHTYTHSVKTIHTLYIQFTTVALMLTVKLAAVCGRLPQSKPFWLFPSWNMKHRCWRTETFGLNRLMMAIVRHADNEPSLITLLLTTDTQSTKSTKSRTSVSLCHRSVLHLALPPPLTPPRFHHRLHLHRHHHHQYQSRSEKWVSFNSQRSSVLYFHIHKHIF